MLHKKALALRARWSTIMGVGGVNGNQKNMCYLQPSKNSNTHPAPCYAQSCMIYGALPSVWCLGAAVPVLRACVCPTAAPFSPQYGTSQFLCTNQVSLCNRPTTDPYSILVLTQREARTVYYDNHIDFTRLFSRQNL